MVRAVTEEITALRDAYFDLAQTAGSQEFASERGWLGPKEQKGLVQLRADADAARDRYTEALATLRQDRSRFHDWVDSLVTPDDSATVRRRKRDMKHGIWWDWLQPEREGWEPSVTVRPEVEADHDGVAALTTAAFEGAAEARITASLREEPGVVSLVAERGGELAGHVLLSPVHIEGGFPAEALALGPLAVAPEAQRRGVGSALVQAALTAAWEAEVRVCFVLGDPAYYRGLHFIRAAPRWRCQWPGTEEAFQVSFAHWVVADQYEGGLVAYHPAFDGAG